MSKEDKDYDDRDFTTRERQRLRRLMDDDDKADAIKTAIKTWIVTIGAIISALAVIKLGLYDFIKWVFR